MTSEALHVRPATEADLPAILKITSASPTAPQWKESDFAAILKPTETMPALLRTLFVAEQTGACVGYAVGSVLRAVFPAEAELESIAVAPGARGKGIGRVLLHQVLRWAAGHGADSVRLEVRQSNHSARRLYERAGFRESGIRRAYYVNPVEDAICMVCPALGGNADLPSGTLA